MTPFLIGLPWSGLDDWQETPRFWNDDVLQRTEAVLEQIDQQIERTRQKQR